MTLTHRTASTAVFKRSAAAAAIVLACALTACGGATVATTAAPIAPAEQPVKNIQPGTWVVMGSSSAAGAGAPAGKGWVELLQASLSSRGAQFANIAKGGTVTYQGLNATALAVSGRPAPDPAINIDQALSRKPVLLLVSYPSNDAALGYSADETIANLFSIRAIATANAVPVIVLSSQPRNLTAGQITLMQSIDQRLAASIGPCFVDVRTPLAAADGRLAAAYDAGDGVHPNEAGHRLIGAQVQATLDGRKCVNVPPG